MLDINFIRENKDAVKAGAAKKKIEIDIDALIAVDDERRKALLSIEEKRAQQNEASKEITQTNDPEAKRVIIEAMTTLKSELQAEETALRDIMLRWQALMVQVPNIPDFSVPEGASEDDNVDVRTWGDIKSFDFEIKNHIELMEALDLADFETGSAVSGFRGYFLKNQGAELEFALWQYTLQFFIQRGFSPMIVPSLVKKEALLGTGYLPQGADDLYVTQDGDYLAGTGEVATMSYFADKVLDAKTLPQKIIVFSPCFRREAGSHSKDTKGLIRVHEFFKLEQVVICEASHEQSVIYHEEITRHTEELMQSLGLPYRVIVMCGADLGLGHVKKYDIEAWVPSQITYRETHSASYFHDFQTRRLNIRYKNEEGRSLFAHSLNNTAAATPRLLVPILENYQNADGTITIPPVLRPYMGGKDTISL